MQEIRLPPPRDQAFAKATPRSCRRLLRNRGPERKGRSPVAATERHFRYSSGSGECAWSRTGSGAALRKGSVSLRPFTAPGAPSRPGLRRRGTMITSAAGIISLLDEEEPELKEFALHKLNAVVNDFWAEISESVDKIEILYEDVGFRSREFAALVASKVFYHLGAFEESLNYALGAGNLFNVNDNSEYVETIIAKCIDHYTKQCVENADLTEGVQKAVDPRLEGIVNKMFQRCLDDHKYKQAIGIALETRRLDIFEKTILESNDVPGMLAYSLKLCMSLMQNKQFRNQVLRVLVKIYMNLEKPDFINVCQCLIFLDDPQAVSDILEKLVKEDNLLMAYQICFDLYESASQQFLSAVIQNLRSVGTPIASVPGSTNTGTVAGPEKEGELMETEEKTGSPIATVKAAQTNPGTKDQIPKMIKILSGEMAIELHLQFLIRNNNTDLMILKNTKDAVRNSVCHTATVIANSFMHCGTTSDQFLRDNLEWLARATNWAKFTATASLGVIHKGHEKEALQLMATYLPKDTSPGSAYQEGGGLYALGLIHANHGGDIIDYLLNQLKNASNDIVRHGGSLGLGLAAMGTARQDVYDLLKTNLYQDDAVTGEAAGLALGLVMLGSKNAQAIEDMVGYAQETQHEKILRGLAVGIALVMYGRMEEADALIESLCRDKDPILRRSGMYTVAMAYCGSGNNKAIRRLLHVAVSDVNDDVRRAAVESLGFILFRLAGKLWFRFPAMVSSSHERTVPWCLRETSAKKLARLIKYCRLGKKNISEFLWEKGERKRRKRRGRGGDDGKGGGGKRRGRGVQEKEERKRRRGRGKGKKERKMMWERRRGKRRGRGGQEKGERKRRKRRRGENEMMGKEEGEKGIGQEKERKRGRGEGNEDRKRKRGRKGGQEDDEVMGKEEGEKERKRTGRGGEEEEMVGKEEREKERKRRTGREEEEEKTKRG
ncbi:26S proteasome non-ATPase regulatory subunit 1 [Crotalus adamanteus]|uniref:26S proteasome non-ATPase regulatory subunit 1 n=1 Tax=Crotalus adamanteus TaxID=8729 RepID=A0AAW1BHP9_CROAD